MIVFDQDIDESTLAIATSYLTHSDVRGDLFRLAERP